MEEPDLARANALKPGTEIHKNCFKVGEKKVYLETVKLSCQVVSRNTILTPKKQINVY